MHDDIRITVGADCSRERCGVGNIRLREPEPIPHVKLRKPRFLQRDRIIIVYIVDANNLPALVQQSLRSMEPDEPGSARYNRFHAGDFFPKTYEVSPARRAAMMRLDAAALSAARKNMVEDIVTSCNNGLCSMP